MRIVLVSIVLAFGAYMLVVDPPAPPQVQTVTAQPDIVGPLPQPNGDRCYTRGVDGLSCLPGPTATATPTPIPSPTPTPAVIVLAEMLSPEPGANLDPSQAFVWSPGIGTVQYWLWVSTVPGDGNVYSQSAEQNSAVTVAGIPQGVPIYVRLWSYVNGDWLYRDYEYIG